MRLAEFGFTGAVGSVDLFRDVEAITPPVALKVLQKVRDLQSRTDVVSSSFALRVAVPSDSQHKPADRIGRTPTVVQELRPRVIAVDRDVLTKGA